MEALPNLPVVRAEQQLRGHIPGSFPSLWNTVPYFERLGKLQHRNQTTLPAHSEISLSTNQHNHLTYRIQKGKA